MLGKREAEFSPSIVGNMGSDRLSFGEKRLVSALIYGSIDSKILGFSIIEKYLSYSSFYYSLTSYFFLFFSFFFMFFSSKMSRVDFFFLILISSSGTSRDMATLMRRLGPVSIDFR